jgi:hypothetical protein
MYKNTVQPTQVPNPKVNLASVLEAGYGDSKKQESFAVQHGYIRDPSSNDNTQIYFHPPSKSLLVNVTGTHNLSDVKTDALLLAGKLQNTDRYKQAKKTISDAKQKYGVDSAILTGHSLGGGIVQQVAGSNDKVHVLDSAMTLGQRVRKGQNVYRSSGDIVSIFGAGNKNVKTLQGKQSLFSPGSSLLKRTQNILDAHKVSNIKDKSIFI